MKYKVNLKHIWTPKYGNKPGKIRIATTAERIAILNEFNRLIKESK